MLMFLLLHGKGEQWCTEDVKGAIVILQGGVNLQRIINFRLV